MSAAQQGGGGNANGDVVAVYRQHESEFASGKEIETASQYFGRPQLMGKSLDSMHSTDEPDFAASVMPGIVLGSGTESNATPSYYLAYTNPGASAAGNNGGAGRVWFHVKVNAEGEEVIVDHGVL
ncbi:hypothetical protein IWW48_000808 [Coemansia sp. RSA 1200]|nr:hypothetical protein IWW48_000808 [Coemansia sp. RSA 1200]